MFSFIGEEGRGDLGVEDLGEFFADGLIAEVECMVWAGVCWGSGVDGSHDGHSFLLSEGVP